MVKMSGEAAMSTCQCERCSLARHVLQSCRESSSESLEGDRTLDSSSDDMSWERGRGSEIEEPFITISANGMQADPV
jgi:hypothetical protein